VPAQSYAFLKTGDDISGLFSAIDGPIKFDFYDEGVARHRLTPPVR
jgi:hypothetical protein